MTIVRVWYAVRYWYRLYTLVSVHLEHGALEGRVPALPARGDGAARGTTFTVLFGGCLWRLGRDGGLETHCTLAFACFPRSATCGRRM